MDYSPPGSSVHGKNCPGKNTVMGCHFLSPRDLPGPGTEPTSPVFRTSTSLLIFCLFGLSVHQPLRTDLWSLQLHLKIVYFFLQFYWFLLYLFWSSLSSVCTNIWLLCLLENWQLCHCQVSLFVLKPVLSVINIPTPARYIFTFLNLVAAYGIQFPDQWKTKVLTSELSGKSPFLNF